jgi:hypothetical protein
LQHHQYHQLHQQDQQQQQENNHQISKSYGVVSPDTVAEAAAITKATHDNDADKKKKKKQPKEIVEKSIVDVPRDSIATNRKKEDDLDLDGLIPRVWNIWPSPPPSGGRSSSKNSTGTDSDSVSFPCIDPGRFYSTATPDQESIYPLGRNCRPSCPTHGLLFTKTYKTGSSTLSGIVIQISKNIAERYRRLKFRSDDGQEFGSTSIKSSTSRNVKGKNSTTVTPSTLMDGLPKLCQSSYMHSEGRLYRHRHVDRSFLMTIVRHPTPRAISEFYHFHVTRRGIDATLHTFRSLILDGDEEDYGDSDIGDNTDHDNGSNLGKQNKKKKRRRTGDDLNRRTKNFYLHHHVWNTTDQAVFNQVKKAGGKKAGGNNNNNNNNNNIDTRRHNSMLRQVAQGILRDFNFIAVTERFDESMVALQMLLRNVTLGDMLYVSAKTNGGYDDGRFQHRCFKIISSRGMTNDLRDYFYNTSSPFHNEWSNRIKWDLLLYKAANRSLDLTIDNVLGRVEFEKQFRRYQQAQKVVNERCAHLAKFPCTNDGNIRQPNETNCLFKDSGCAYECIDDVAKELNLYD